MVVVYSGQNLGTDSIGHSGSYLQSVCVCVCERERVSIRDSL